MSALKNDAIIVLGSSGTCVEVFLQNAKLPRGTRVINSMSLGSMGYAIPQALGVSIASGKEIICIEGDGSFALNIQ